MLELVFYCVASGRNGMEYMMAVKTEISEHRRACLADHTCPELQAKPTQRFTQCVDGTMASYPAPYLIKLRSAALGDLSNLV